MRERGGCGGDEVRLRKNDRGRERITELLINVPSIS